MNLNNTKPLTAKRSNGNQNTSPFQIFVWIPTTNSRVILTVQKIISGETKLMVKQEQVISYDSCWECYPTNCVSTGENVVQLKKNTISLHLVNIVKLLNFKHDNWGRPISGLGFLYLFLLWNHSCGWYRGSDSDTSDNFFPTEKAMACILEKQDNWNTYRLQKIVKLIQTCSMLLIFIYLFFSLCEKVWSEHITASCAEFFSQMASGPSVFLNRSHNLVSLCL